MKRFRVAGDVSELPTVVFGARGTLWWGTVAFMAIEGMTVAIGAASYLYVRKNFYDWPPPPTALPSLLIPTIGVIVMVASIIAMHGVDKAAKRLDKPAVTRGLILMSLFGLMLVALRWFDFRALNTRWDSNAYGSTAWAAVGFHSSLLFFEFIETSVFAVLAMFGPWEAKHFADTEDNAIYWYFMCLIWMPVYVLLYISPRFL